MKQPTTEAFPEGVSPSFTVSEIEPKPIYNFLKIAIPLITRSVFFIYTFVSEFFRRYFPEEIPLFTFLHAF